MVPVCADLEKLELIAGLDLLTYLPQCLINRNIDHRPPILGREHQMVEQHRDVVTLVDIPAHPPRLRRKRRGMQPKAIQLGSTWEATSVNGGFPRYAPWRIRGDFDQRPAGRIHLSASTSHPYSLAPTRPS